MATILCDISAWQYWRTPPELRNLCIDVTVATTPVQEGGLGIPISLLRRNANAREADACVHGRILTDLKGVTLPVHVMVDAGSGLVPSAVTKPHRMPSWIRLRKHTVSLGNGLYVLSPEVLLLTGSGVGKIARAKMMYEACGIFSLLPTNARMAWLLRRLRAEDILTRSAEGSQAIYGYYDESGAPLSFCDPWGDPLPWSPVFDRNGTMTSMWKRPPLTSTQAIEAVAPSLTRARGLRASLAALSICRNGAASPLEAYAHLLLCSGCHIGGESWGNPELNRRIALTPQAQALAHTSFCIGDLVWAARKRVLEVHGEGFHADSLGFRLDTGRRAGLESMGYEAPELTYEQMANLELFDAVLPSVANKLGFSLQRRTPAFLRRRDRLHRELFGVPYDPDSGRNPLSLPSPFGL